MRKRLHVYCDINDLVSRYLIGAKIIPYTSYRWYKVSKNGTTLQWYEIEVVRGLLTPNFCPCNNLSKILSNSILVECLTSDSA